MFGFFYRNSRRLEKLYLAEIFQELEMAFNTQRFVLINSAWNVDKHF